MVQLKNNPLHSSLKSNNNLNFFYILLLGLLIRIIIIPFFGHIDVLSEARRVYFWTENNIFFDTISRNTTMFIEAVFLKLTLFLLPDEKAMFYLENMRNSTAIHPHSFEFVSHTTIFRTLFVLKLPFLVFDLLTAVVLYSYHERSSSALTSCKLWLFNPVTIFAFYIFGRFESIPIFFIAAAILATKRKRFLLAALLLGLSVNGRELMILYAPIFMIAVFAEPLSQMSLQKKVAALLLSFLALVIVLQLYVPFFNDVQTSLGKKAGSIAQEKRVQHLFAFNIHSIRLIPFVYSFICIWVWSSRVDIHKKLLLGCGLAMMSFFAFSSHTAHFTSWMVIFPAFFIGYIKDMTRPFLSFCLAWLLYWCFLTDLGVFTHWLASAYSLHFVGIPTIPQFFNYVIGNIGAIDLRLIIHLLRTFFVATLFYMAFQMIKFINYDDVKKT